jgi:uncharacterized membrane protein YkgB
LICRSGQGGLWPLAAAVQSKWDVRFTPKAGAAVDDPRVRFGPKTDSCTAAKKSLFRKVPSARPAMKRKAGTAAGRSTKVEPTKILFSGDGPALTPILCLLAQVSTQTSNSGTAGDKKAIMIKDFNVSEKGHGSYRLLGILRWVMVLIFISFGIQKFTPQSAHGIALYISNSPFVSWLAVFGIRGEADLLGTIELTTAALLAAGAFIPILSALGALMGIGTFAITWSFFFSTPGVVRWSVSTDPIAWNLTGEFLFKDVVLLCVCIVLFLASLPKKVVPLRSN